VDFGPCYRCWPILPKLLEEHEPLPGGSELRPIADLVLAAFSHCEKNRYLELWGMGMGLGCRNGLKRNAISTAALNYTDSKHE
jgi:hypothetical protein